MTRHRCDFCARDFLNRGGLYIHVKHMHGIVIERSPRAKRSTRGKGASQAKLSGFARVQQIAVRGRNANSAESWLQLAGVMFGAKRGAA